MPGYGISRGRRGLLPWKWARTRLEKNFNYWIATTRPDGGPHAMAVWGVWFKDAFYFSTGRESRKARNLAVDPRCVVHTESGKEAVIVEGVTKEVAERSLPRRLGELYYAKYKFKLDPSLGPIFAVRPRVAFAFIESKEFTTTATRWRFRA
jgi:hypothetical protein